MTVAIIAVFSIGLLKKLVQKLVPSCKGFSDSGVGTTRGSNGKFSLLNSVGKPVIRILPAREYVFDFIDNTVLSLHEYLSYQAQSLLTNFGGFAFRKTVDDDPQSFQRLCPRGKSVEELEKILG
ncbi:hypothetical protein QCA50_011211 [Cerrena zonata]|uniref:Uncharacterized protein n=1 Tax=Cerrena zonata TaxID=2478898 RepID=A0AAW0G3H7_9APHY